MNAGDRVPLRYLNDAQRARWRKLWLADTQEIDGRREGFGPWLRRQLEIRMAQLETEG